MKINIALFHTYQIIAVLSIVKWCDIASGEFIGGYAGPAEKDKPATFIKRYWTSLGDLDDQSNAKPKESNLTDRIVGGSEVMPNSIPWQVALVVKKDKEFICGGTILCPKFVMSAGHCAHPDPNQLMIVAGKHDFNKDEESESEHAIKNIHLHPEFKNHFHYQDNDFAIVELSEPIALREEAKALFLPRPTDTEFGEETKFLVSGWGAMETGILEHGGLSKVLNSVTLPWISDDDCKEAYKDPKKFDPKEEPAQFRVSDSNICAGVLGKGKIDACKGDSGGPLAWIDPETDEVKLIGAVSFGFGCALDDSPGVYAELTYALDWIKNTIGNCNEETCQKGQCMTADTLDRRTMKSFRRITPF